MKKEGLCTDVEIDFNCMYVWVWAYTKNRNKYGEMEERWKKEMIRRRKFYWNNNICVWKMIYWRKLFGKSSVCCVCKSRTVWRCALCVCGEIDWDYISFLIFHLNLSSVIQPLLVLISIGNVSIPSNDRGQKYVVLMENFSWNTWINLLKFLYWLPDDFKKIVLRIEAK